MEASRTGLGVSLHVASLAILCGVVAVACSASTPAGKSGGSSGGAGGNGGGQGGVATTGGSSGTGGSVAGGNPAGGTAGASAGGSGGAAGGAGGSSAGNAGTGGTTATAWTCPAGPFEAPTLGGTATRVSGVPIPDSFNMDNGNFGNIEGPVWLGDALYVSEMSYMAYDQTNQNVKMARVLKVTGSGVEIAIADSGSNGLALDNQGNLVAGVHKDGSISRLSLSGAAAVPIAASYMDSRFDSPNDLAVRSDGNIYFSDPSHQSPNTPPQSATRVYRIDPNGTVTPIEDLNQPNGVTLSPDQNTLYVAGGQLRKYPVNPDGSVGAGQNFLQAGGGGGDGMVVDCAGNLYVAGAQGAGQAVTVYSAAGMSLGTISVPEVQSATNVAFGGPERKTLYVTGLGNQKGLFSIEMNVPGYPY